MKDLKDIKYIINKTFIKDFSEGNKTFTYNNQSYLITDVAFLVNDFFGDKLVIYNNKDFVVITDNWKNFKVEYTHHEIEPEEIIMYVKKVNNSNSDTNAIIKFLKAFIGIQEK